MRPRGDVELLDGSVKRVFMRKLSATLLLAILSVAACAPALGISFPDLSKGNL